MLSFSEAVWERCAVGGSKWFRQWLGWVMWANNLRSTVSRTNRNISWPSAAKYGGNISGEAYTSCTVVRWARVNNLQFSRSETKDIIFVDKRRKHRVSKPPLLPGITRVTSMRILWVTLTTSLSVSDHVRDASKSAVCTSYFEPRYAGWSSSGCVPVGHCR